MEIFRRKEDFNFRADSYSINECSIAVKVIYVSWQAYIYIILYIYYISGYSFQHHHVSGVIVMKWIFRMFFLFIMYYIEFIVSSALTLILHTNVLKKVNLEKLYII